MVPTRSGDGMGAAQEAALKDLPPTPQRLLLYCLFGANYVGGGK